MKTMNSAAETTRKYQFEAAGPLEKWGRYFGFDPPLSAQASKSLRRAHLSDDPSFPPTDSPLILAPSKLIE